MLWVGSNPIINTIKLTRFIILYFIHSHDIVVILIDLNLETYTIFVTSEMIMIIPLLTTLFINFIVIKVYVLSKQNL